MYNADEPIDIEFRGVFPNTIPKQSENFTADDVDILRDLISRYGEAGVVEGVAGFLLGATEEGRDLVEIFGNITEVINKTLEKTERTGLILYAAAQAVHGIHKGDESGVQVTVIDERV